MTTLENKILEAQDAYYNGTPIMNDIEFDALWEQLKKEQPDSEILQAVGADHTDGFAKVDHMIIMGSQNKAKNIEELNEWYDNNDIEPDTIAQYKMDGISLELTYKNGKLQKAVTRGDGHTGDDITANVKKMQGVVKTLKSDYTGAVRGEILMSRKEKDEFFSDKANCRNAASGVAKRKDGEGCEHLTVVVYDAQPLDMNEENSFKYQTLLQTWLEGEGFKVAPWQKIENFTAEKAKELLDKTFEDFDNLEFDIDGLVIKQNKIDVEDIMTNYRPKTQIALKEEQNIVSVKSTGIEWSIKNGTFTPVILFEPVEILGATISRASASNVAMLELLDFEVGDTIGVIRAGMIIPKVVANFSKEKKLDKYIPQAYGQSAECFSTK